VVDPPPFAFPTEARRALFGRLRSRQSGSAFGKSLGSPEPMPVTPGPLARELQRAAAAAAVAVAATDVALPPLARAMELSPPVDLVRARSQPRLRRREGDYAVDPQLAAAMAMRNQQAVLAMQVLRRMQQDQRERVSRLWTE
jgi:hypothetical protein